MKTTTAASTLLVLFLLTGVNQGVAQEAQTLFNNDVAHGGAGGPMVSFSDIDGELGVWVGGRGGWIINFDNNHAITLGGGGYGLVTEHGVPDADFGDPDTDYFAFNSYGGFVFEYTNRSYSLVHPTVSVLLGAGGLEISDRDFNETDHNSDQYFVFEPNANLELNITDFFRIGVGASYRLTNGINRAGFSDSDFSGLNGLITLKFGSFL
ncbi:MAG: hypothetical protein WD038_04030 [Balneolales bacterium]